MTPDELFRINEEIIFWEKYMFDICVNKKIPEQLPDNYSVKKLLTEFREERDYYSLVKRLSLLRGYRDHPESFIERN